MLVRVGQQVQEGDAIGWEGSTGNSTGPHLHFTVVHIGYGLAGYVVEDVVNPEPLLRAPEPEPEPEPEPPRTPAQIRAEILELLEELVGLANA